MRIPIYQVDAFAARPFAGNPAAVCPLERWLPDAVMQSIAAENNLSETAFVVARTGGGYGIRWFTPACEVDLCGHATLASAYVVCNHLEPGADRVDFHSQSGPLKVTRNGTLLALDFPSRPPRPCTPPAALAPALGAEPHEVLAARDYLVAYEDAATVRALAPDMQRLAEGVDRMVIVTAPGDAGDVDFVSRFFAPAEGIPEDPVTGSAHCTLVPYWSRRLGKPDLLAHQVSQRGGELRCEDRGERVTIAGAAVLYLEGTILVPDPA